MLVVVICGDVDSVALRGVTVVRWGEHHGRLICLGVLVVEVDHTSAAVRGNRHTVEKQEGYKEGER